MVWLRTDRIALFDRSSNLLANRSAPTAVWVLPCQAVLFAGSAYNALGVLVHVIAFALLQCVFMLCFQARTEVDKVNRLVTLDQAEITQVKFPAKARSECK